MKKYYILTLLVLVSSFTAFAQAQYEVQPDRSGGKILKGIISRELVEKDSSYAAWWANSLRGFSPNAEAIAAFRKYKDSVQLVAFMGTWCEDSHFIIPKLYSLLDAAGYAQQNVSLLGADRNKKTLGHLAEAWNVTNVPTIIVMKKGKEIGRVVEYGKSGLFDKDLGEIVNSIATATH